MTALILGSLALAALVSAVLIWAGIGSIIAAVIVSIAAAGKEKNP